MARKVEQPEEQQQAQGTQIAAIYGMVKKLMAPPARRRRPIGFIPEQGENQC